MPRHYGEELRGAQAQLEALESGIRQGLRCARGSRFLEYRPFTRTRFGKDGSKEASRGPEKNPADKFLIAPLASRLRITAGALLIAHSGRDKPTPAAVTGDLRPEFYLPGLVGSAGPADRVSDVRPRNTEAVMSPAFPRAAPRAACMPFGKPLRSR